MRNAECGVRNGRVSELARDLSLLLRIPHSAFRILVLLAACTPITTRPAFRPDPRALTVVLDARPERVTTVLDSLVAAESLERSEEHTSELQSLAYLVCRLLLEKK